MNHARITLFDHNEDMSWQESGACRGCDPDLFFPGRFDAAATKQAIAVCNQCPVRAECLGYALRHKERQGVWGGLKPRERRKILEQRRHAA